MSPRLPHVREPSYGEPDVCVHCREEWVDLLTLYERDECSVRLRAEVDRLRAEVTDLWRVYMDGLLDGSHATERAEHRREGGE
jgi:hypothetical protein